MILRCLAALWLVKVVPADIPLEVSSVRSSQRTGTKLVDVYYDLKGGLPPYIVSVKGSADGGVTWTLPVATVGGDVGLSVAEGKNRRIVWNAGTDWPEQYSENVRFKVLVEDASDLEPKGATLTLSSPTGTIWALPATVTMRVTHPGSVFFFGSNGRSETGTPLFSNSPWMAGATFYRCDSVTGFPPRSGGFPINRLGGSSFIAVKDREVWICASVGAFLNGAYWEYQIRYYSGDSGGGGSPTVEIGTVPASGFFTTPMVITSHNIRLDYQ